MLRVGVFHEDLIPVVAYRLEPGNGVDDIYAHAAPQYPIRHSGDFILMANTDLQINRPDDLQDLNVISPEPAYNPKSRPVFGGNHA
ncbi:hypothetical protein GCM10007919_58000 [Rhizobium indigoferae]|nr:hypothetical protein GCM10007919_58000 [Rhizobium indigoferae]